MPYQASSRLPGERANKLGHLEVIKSPLVNQLMEQFGGGLLEDEKADATGVPWQSMSSEDAKDGVRPLRLIFAVDGSLQIIRSDSFPYREVAFVKTALLRLDQTAVAKVDRIAPHPLVLRDLMKDAALYHATVLPMRHMGSPGMTNYDLVRGTIFESLRDQSLNAEPFETLKWLAYEKWSDRRPRSPDFECPKCGTNTGGLAYDTSEGDCPHCKGHLYLSDMLSFHLDMAEDGAPDRVASAYMLMHETLLLFSGIRYFWENAKNDLRDCLFIKDGPLSLGGQYSKLVIPIRRLFATAKNKGIDIHAFGQEKTGAFADHLALIARFAPEHSVFLPDNEYIRNQVQKAPDRGEPYGHRTNYGNKLFVKNTDGHFMVISVPTGDYVDSQKLSDLIGVDRILATIPSLISYRYEGALQPIVLANGVASLSTYPSAKVLKVFSGIG